MYQYLWHREYGVPSRRSIAAAKSGLITIKSIVDAGYTVAGKTGEAKLNVLRNLGAIELTRDGMVKVLKQRP